MNQENFTQKREFLYHLTDARNVDAIIARREIYCTNFIIDSAGMLSPDEKRTLKRSKRDNHMEIQLNGRGIFIRDQKPLSMVALPKCLTHGYDVGDYIELLNGRVFFWPTIDRLWRHYKRYVAERPAILKVRTDELLNLNSPAEFCHLNSGATRANSYLGGVAPIRGDGTFLTIENFNRPISSVAEVTFPNRCQLPATIWVAENPNGPWELT